MNPITIVAFIAAGGFAALFLIAMAWNIKLDTQWSQAIADKEEAELKAHWMPTAIEEIRSLKKVIASQEAENAALVEDYENAILALTECQGYVAEKHAARLDFLISSFVDRRTEEDLQNEIEALTNVNKFRAGQEG